jgi:uncharacterized phage protein (TIGR01671 family)
MREIKFRAWEKNMKQMIPVNQINFETGIINSDSAWRMFNEVELMQYTGVKDRNGKEVYEGDIVKHAVFGIKDITWGSDYDCLKGNKGFMYNNTLAFLHDRDAEEIEIIGNIYENTALIRLHIPELLKGCEVAVLKGARY